MNGLDASFTSPIDREACVALIFALVAESISIYYEHEKWITNAQGVTLAAAWLSRSKRNMSMAMRKSLSELSDQLARQITATLSHEAGLYISHEMQESLDSRYQSEIGQSVRVECERLFDSRPPT
jgi:general stress protein CsbA